MGPTMIIQFVNFHKTVMYKERQVWIRLPAIESPVVTQLSIEEDEQDDDLDFFT